MKYKTLGKPTITQLDTIVEQHLELGWKLYGNQYYTGFIYIQVVILE
jgi:hypothetical protein